MVTISVVLIVKNEEANLYETLESVSWADEIIIVDSGSEDATTSIARKFTRHVYLHDWPGFGAQKNRALDYASMDWVLSLDADERVTPELRIEILQAIREHQADGFFIPRKSQFCGNFVRHCGWYPDYVLRLFKREKGRFSDSLVHESLILHGTTAKLSFPLLHYSYRNKIDVTRKIEQYSLAAAQQMLEKGKKAVLLDAPLRAFWAFFRTYFLRLGILDGRTGWDIARMNAITTYRKYKLLRNFRAH
ncbi:Lipopolysaccharide core biosynthesis glycosyltransferase WaaE [Gammaproteobacteria bacterium]